MSWLPGKKHVSQGFTDAARNEVQASGGRCIDLRELDKALSRVD
jgi:ribosomal protein L18E